MSQDDANRFREPSEDEVGRTREPADVEAHHRREPVAAEPQGASANGNGRVADRLPAPTRVPLKGQQDRMLDR